MINLKSVDDLARRLHELIPSGVREASGDLQKNFRSTLQVGLGKLDLVTREEFELVESMLLLVEARLDALTGPNH
jgi:BMFP domain-containing protein YqiC